MNLWPVFDASRQYILKGMVLKFTPILRFELIYKVKASLT